MLGSRGLTNIGCALRSIVRRNGDLGANSRRRSSVKKSTLSDVVLRSSGEMGNVLSGSVLTGRNLTCRVLDGIDQVWDTDCWNS